MLLCRANLGGNAYEAEKTEEAVGKRLLAGGRETTAEVIGFFERAALDWVEIGHPLLVVAGARDKKVCAGVGKKDSVTNVVGESCKNARAQG